MLYLIRHGKANAGIDELDPGLDETGRRQAEAAALAVKAVRAARLVVSPMRRTRETAEPIARVLGLEPELRDEVSEVFDPEMPLDDRRTMLAPFLASYWSDQPAHLNAWRSRVAQSLVSFAEAGDVVVVSHYVAICAAIGVATNDDRVVPVEIANCSLTLMDVNDGRLVLVESGRTDHLRADLITGKLNVLPGGPVRP
jgi:broad specificity phosphatase PhoE